VQNRADRLREHIRAIDPLPGFQIQVGMDSTQIRGALNKAGWKISLSRVKNELDTPQIVRRDDGKMVPVWLVTFR
jgi:hypothetical protein